MHCVAHAQYPLLCIGLSCTPEDEKQVCCACHQVEQYVDMHVPGESQRRGVCQGLEQRLGHDEVADDHVGRDIGVPVCVCPAAAK